MINENNEKTASCALQVISTTETTQREASCWLWILFWLFCSTSDDWNLQVGGEGGTEILIFYVDENFRDS